MPTPVETPGSAEVLSVDANQWIQRYGDYLFHFAVGQVRDTSVAEDLVQETLLSALKARDNFGGRSAERTWLVGILRHKVCDYLRWRARERLHREYVSVRDEGEASEDSMAWFHDVATECVSPSRRMELAEFRENLERALGRLPRRFAEAFQMYEIEERSNEEICAQLQVSEGNLWVILHRARKRLREELSHWWQSGVEGAPVAPTLRTSSQPG